MSTTAPAAPTTKPCTPRSSTGTTTPPKTKTPAQPATAAAKTRSARRKALQDELDAAAVVLADAVENEELLDPATNKVVDTAAPMLLKLSQQFADGLDISDSERALFTRAIDLIETRMDQKFDEAVAKANGYTDEKVDALALTTSNTFAAFRTELDEVHEGRAKTNERVDDIDARLTAATKLPLGAIVVGLIAGFITFLIWINTVHLQQDVKLPDGSNFAFVYEYFNGPLGGFVAGLTVFAIVAIIGSFFKIERPLRSEPKPIKATVRKPENSKAIAAEEPKALETSSATDTTSKE